MFEEELPLFKLYHAKTTLYFGLGAVSKMEKLLHSSENVLILTGKKSAEKSGALTDVVGILESKGVNYKIIKGIEPNPKLHQCEEIVEQVKESKLDGIIAIGGGSVLDTSKVVAAAVGDGVKCKSFVIEDRRPENPLKLYTINLTHGTGSEIDRYSVINIPEESVKKGFPVIYPDYSFDDPRYTMTLPRFQTIITTLDAFYHSYEAATGIRSNPFVLDLSDKAVYRISLYLSRAVDEPESFKARYELLYSSMIAGIAIDYAGTHIIHLVEHGLSGVNDKLEHAAGLAIVGPQLVPFVHKYSPMASAKILRNLTPDVKPLINDTGNAAKAVQTFQQSVGFDKNLGEYGFDKKDIDTAVEKIWPSAAKYWGDKPFGIEKDVLKKLLYEVL